MLELYANPSCPYCLKVMGKMTELNLDFIFRSHKYENAKESWGFKIGGKTQVPLLVDQSRNIVMYESEDIINYLEDNYSN